MLALFLFTQFALVAQACELPVNSPAAAFLENCHDSEVGNANICLAHCLQSSQALDAQQPIVVAAPVSFIVVADDFFERRLISHHLPVPVSDPPASIRFCSFQI